MQNNWLINSLNRFLVPDGLSQWSFKTEVLAGAVNFLAAGYIVVVNPDILSSAGMSKPALITATSFAAAAGCFLMAFWPKVPVLLAPGMGLNAFFAFTLCQKEGIPWQTALGIVFLSGVLFLLLSISGLRQRIIYSIPRPLRFGIPVGIGLFIAFIGFENMGLIVAHPETLVSLGALKPTVLAGILGLIAVFALEHFNFKGSMLLIILAITFLAIGLGWVGTPDVWLGAPPSIAPVAFELDIWSAFEPVFWVPIFIFLYLDLFDSIGTLTAVSYQAGLNKGDKIEGLDKMLRADATATVVGSVLGTSTVTAYVESGAGIATGGRTGWTAFFTGVLFLLAPLFSGIITSVPTYATAVALVVVGVQMMKYVREIDFSDWTEGPTAFLTIILMPLTFSIATGICFGIIFYVGIMLVTGRWRQLSPVLVIMALISITYLVFNTMGLDH